MHSIYIFTLDIIYKLLYILLNEWIQVCTISIVAVHMPACDHSVR